jgi:ABC-type sugar transport system substrate-binding protein
MRTPAWRRRLGVAATILAVVVPVAACGSDDSGGNADAAGGSGGKTIGISVLNMRDPDLAHMSEAMKAKASSLGQKLVVVDAKGDVATELQQVEDLVTKNVDAIIMMPIDGKASQTAAKQANNADIPLFTLSTEFAPDAKVDLKSYIGVDDTEAGRMQAEDVAKVLPQGGKILYLVGTYGASWTDRRKAGFMEKKPSNIDIVSELQANGSRDEAKRITEDWLRKYPSGDNIVGLVAHNDEMAIGAAQAIKEAGRLDEFKVILGVDGTKPGLEAVKAGEMTGTVLQRSAEQGEKAVEVVSQDLAGKPIDKRYDLPFVLVTKDNVDDELAKKDG